MSCRKLFRKKQLSNDNFETPLARCLNLFDLTLLSVSGMIGSGIYVLTGVVAKEYTGPAIIFANLLAGLACLFGACCYAEFAARIPRAGSSYIYIYESIGEILAFLVGFSSIVGGLTGLGVSARVWSEYFDALFNNQISSWIKKSLFEWPQAPKPFATYPDLLALTITICLIFTLLVGLRNSKWLTNSLTVLNISALVFIGISGFLLGNRENYRPFNPFGIGSLVHGSSLLLYSFIGFDMASLAIEEAKNPSRIVPQATVISLLIVTVLYSFAGASLTFLTPYHEIHEDSAFAHAYELSHWSWARYVISVAIVFSAGGNLLSGAYGTIRIIYAMSNDGLLPSKLSYVNVSRQVPVIATISSCVIIAFLATFFDIKDLIGFSNISALLSYTGVSIGLLIERYNHHRPYHLLVTNNTTEDAEEAMELTGENDEIQSTSSVDLHQSDPFFTRLTRQLCRSCLHSIDNNLSPKICAILLLIICIANTSLMAIFLIYFFERARLIHRILVITGVLLDVLLKIFFCLLRPKEHEHSLLFTCPGVPLVPLINLNIFIFLMIFQDAHDWFAYLIILVCSLLIYFAYGYRHSKSR